MTSAHSSTHRRGLTATVRRDIDPETQSVLALTAPRVGYYSELAAVGTHVVPGQVIGRVDVLGEAYSLVVPADAGGRVIAHTRPQLARPGFAYGEAVLHIDTSTGTADARAAGSLDAASRRAGNFFCSPASGRFYRKPAPDRPDFISVGDELEIGRVVGLLEVMKTFSRISLAGTDLPARVRVTQVLVNDQDEVSAGDRLFAFEPVSNPGS